MNDKPAKIELKKAKMIVNNLSQFPHKNDNIAKILRIITSNEFTLNHYKDIIVAIKKKICNLTTKKQHRLLTI